MRKLTRDLKTSPDWRRRVAQVCSAFSCVCLLGWGIGPVSAAPSAKDVLAKMGQADRSANYSATVTVTTDGRRQVMHVWRSGSKRRFEWLEPALRKGDVLVDDGENTWLYFRAENSTIESKSASRNSWGLNSDAQFAGTGNVDGRPAWKLKAGKRMLWVDTETGVRLKADFGGGQMEVSDFKPGPVAFSRFTVGSLPKGKLQSMDGQMYLALNQARQAQPWLKVPKNLPAAYSLESAIVSDTTAWLRYTDGKGRFSLFLQKADEGEIAPQKQEGGWFWKGGGIRYFATGVSEAAATGMAGSVE